jgi:uncharacterized membrane protein
MAAARRGGRFLGSTCRRGDAADRRWPIERGAIGFSRAAGSGGVDAADGGLATLMNLFKGREAHGRSLAKAVSWRIFASIDTFIISFFVTGKMSLAGTIAAVEVMTKIVIYYLHERACGRAYLGGTTAPDSVSSDSEIGHGGSFHGVVDLAAAGERPELKRMRTASQSTNRLQQRRPQQLWEMK